MAIRKSRTNPNPKVDRPVTPRNTDYTAGTPKVPNTSGITLGRETQIDENYKRTVDAITQMLGSSSVLEQILGQFGVVHGKDNPFLSLLMQLGGTLADNPTGKFDEDITQKLLEMYLSQLTKNEQRTYDEGALAEQRLYDNPLNQLSRLTSAGISRDAAIQMLQGTSESPLVGSGADSAVSPFQHTASDKVSQALQTASGFVGAIGSLVGLGFSIPQAIQQTHYLKNANFLTDQQNRAYKSAGQAYSILSAAGAAAESFDSVGSAVKSIQDLASNGNEMAAQFVANGGIADIQGNAPFASNVLRDMYRSENASEMFRRELRRADLQNTLMNAQIETEYQSVMESLQRIFESDERVKLYREQLKTQQQITKQETYAGTFAEFQGDILEGLKGLTDEQGNSVTSMMSYNQFAEVWEMFQESSVHRLDPDKFRNWCHDNWDAACDLATINQIANSTYRINLDSDNPTAMSTILRISRLMRDSGLGEQINSVVNTAGTFLQPVLRGR